MHRLYHGSSRLALSLMLVAFAGLLLGGCADDGSDGLNGRNGSNGTDGTDGAEGPPGPIVINASQVSDEVLASLDVVSEITNITIASPPVVTFKLTTSKGVPIVGIVPFWEDSNRYIRFTLDKLVPGEGTAPSNWVAYVRDGSSNEPDYDTGSSLVDNNDGTYTFTFMTDVTNVPGVTYDPTLTTRVAGQIGASSPPLEAQNVWMDFVPNGSAVTMRRDIAVMESCNECHDDLVFHGRRFLVEYCVNCHNPDLAEGEGDMAFMIHKIHAAGKFDVLDNGFDATHVTYPQNLADCRKCHNGDDAATPQGNYWKTVPNAAACDGCHDAFANNKHPAGPQPDTSCAACHSPTQIEGYHTTPNATPNNPNLLPGQVNITYELIDAVVAGNNNVTITFKILSDGTPLNLTNLPADLAGPGRYPGLLLAWAQPQGNLSEPMDYNNLGMTSAQPISLGLDDFSPIAGEGSVGTISFNAGTGVNTVVVTDGASQFPVGATLRAVGLQGYFQQDLGDEDPVPLHTPSAVIAVSGDDVRRVVVDNNSCMNCHEWFEGHGGNRVMNMDICTLCHVPNLSSSGRTITSPSASLLAQFADADEHDMLDPSIDPQNPLTYPEDAQNFKDLVHGIHSGDDRTRPFTHVRGGRQGYYDWSHITFPRGASTSNCMLCHKAGTYELPLAEGLLPTTVRTTQATDGQDQTIADAQTAFDDVPNATDWINTPTASACFYCHTGTEAMNHMQQNGGLLSVPNTGPFTSREKVYQAAESCAVCHGPGSVADIDVAHDR